jgi:hypothetical protein
MSPKWARGWFAATAVCVLAGVAISAVNAANSSVGHFHPAAARFFNTFTFFTIQSNLLVGVAALLLALRLERSSTAFAVLRLCGLTAITVTGIVFHAVLSKTLDLAGWAALGKRTVWLSLIFPACWLAFTLIRGAIAHWYPYPFIDVTQLGYLRAAVNCVWVALLLLGLSVGARLLDARLDRGSAAQ